VSAARCALRARNADEPRETVRDVESVSLGQGTFRLVTGAGALHSQRRDRTPRPAQGGAVARACSQYRKGLRLDQSTRFCINSCLLAGHLVGPWADWRVDAARHGGAFATGAIANQESAAAQRICRHHRLQRCEQRPPGRFRTASKSAERRRWGAYRARKGAKDRETLRFTGNQRRAEKPCATKESAGIP
jgi:hypothetical protein